jgi:hypothetical protein
VAGMAAFCYGGLALIEALWLKATSRPGLMGQLSTSASNLTYLGYFLTVSAMLMIIAYIANYFAGLLTEDERTIRKQLDEINTLHAFTRSMSNMLSSESAVRMLVERAMQIESASACTLLLFNEKGEAMFAATQGIADAARYTGQPLPVDHVLVRSLISDNQGVYAPDVDAVPGLRAYCCGHRPSRSTLSL